MTDERIEPEMTWEQMAEGAQLFALSRCNQPVPAWKFVQPMRCNLERGHAGECDNIVTNRPENRGRR